MATRIKTPRSDLYQQDLYAWSKAQVDLLRAGRFDELDLANLTEEIEDVGGALTRSVRSHVRTIIEHLLKLEHSPATEPRLGWRSTIRAQRSGLVDDLTPSLRPDLPDELPELYARARHDADGSLRDHGEHGAADSLPASCPYTLDQITGDWLP